MAVSDLEKAPPSYDTTSSDDHHHRTHNHAPLAPARSRSLRHEKHDKVELDEIIASEQVSITGINERKVRRLAPSSHEALPARDTATPDFSPPSTR